MTGAEAPVYEETSPLKWTCDWRVAPIYRGLIDRRPALQGGDPL